MVKANTRNAIMETASVLFFKHGFRRVSIEDICHITGVVRKTFYDYFSNKAEIVRCVLDNYIDTVTQNYIAIMEQDIPFSDKLNLIIDMKMESAKGFSREFMEDLFSPKNDDLKEYFDRKTEQNKALVYNFYIKAQQRGDIRDDIPIDVIINLQNNLCELFKNDEFRSKFQDIPTMLKQVSELYLFGVIKRTR